MASKTTKPDLFLELAKPDKDGFSRIVYVKEFESNPRYSRLMFGNGGDWCREDGTLGKKYNINRIKEKNAIVAIQLEGYKKVPIEKSIPASIKKEIKDKRCVILDTGKPECDHKDGRRDDPRFNDPNQVRITDFQPLSKTANNAKRQHCKTCRETGKRFDATRLGYAVKQHKGREEYNGSCIGCYWYDPVAFNKAVSKDFKKEN